MKAFITGITGFVGGALTQRLLSDGYDVIGLARDPSKFGFTHPKLQVVKGDLSNFHEMTSSVVNEELIDNETTVYHCAATLGAAQASKKTYMKVNLDATIHLYSLAVKMNASKFVFISSMGAAGPMGSFENPMTEDMLAKPISYYSVSKKLAEDYLIAEGKLPTVILRPPVIYGPGMNKKSGAAMIFKGCTRRFFPVIGNAKNYISFSYIDNVVEGIISCSQAVTEGTEIFFVSDETPYITQELVNEIKSQLGTNTKLIKIPYYPMLILSWIVEKFSKLIRRNIGFNTELTKGLATNAYVFSIDKAKSSGFAPSVDLKTGISRTLELLL